MRKIYPVVLSGGTGSRLWPVSRAQMPKQLMPLVSTRSMLQETILRLNGHDRITAPVVISNATHRFIIAAQLQELGIQPAVHVLEPIGRNTAPAAAVASKIVADIEAEGILLLLPADHHITDIEGFRQAVIDGPHRLRQVT